VGSWQSDSFTDFQKKFCSKNKSPGICSQGFFSWVKNGFLRRQPLDDYQFGKPTTDHRLPLTAFF